MLDPARSTDEESSKPEAPVFTLPFDSQEGDEAHAASQSADDEKLQRLGVDVARGVSWMYWAVGLSVVNAITAAAGMDWSFALALASALLPAVVMQQIGVELHLPWVGAIGVVIALVPIGVLFGLVRLAKNGRPWAFAVAMVLYAGDAAIFAAVGDWLGVILHAACLFFAFRAWRALHELATPTRTPFTD